jgi:hypothetical protein
VDLAATRFNIAIEGTMRKTVGVLIDVAVQMGERVQIHHPMRSPSAIVTEIPFV